MQVPGDGAAGSGLGRPSLGRFLRRPCLRSTFFVLSVRRPSLGRRNVWFLSAVIDSLCRYCITRPAVLVVLAHGIYACD